MSELLMRRFAAIGARITLAGPALGAPQIDIGKDRGGEFFEIRFSGALRPVELEVVDVEPADRHLLLLVRDGGDKSKFLCGHDERHWFVAAIPETARGVTGVMAAKAALQPPAVRELVTTRRPKDPFRRRNSAYLRQGEWFFVPAPELRVAEAAVLRDEPLTRGRGKAHLLRYAYREGGELVYANYRNRSGIGGQEYAELTDSERRGGGWTRFVRDPDLYARGSVRHPDHATVQLDGWHRVLMNTEQGARAMQHVAFLD